MKWNQVLTLALVIPAAARAQETSYPSSFSPRLAENRTVQDALRYIDERFDAQVEKWTRITQIPAKSRQEEARAAYVRTELEALGLDVAIDSIGNVIARRPGTGNGPTVVFAAHLDTVHPVDTDVTVTRRNGQLRAPGVFDNSASVANMLQAARALHAAGLSTKGDVIFIGTVQEELGLMGMKYWLDQNPGVADMLVALDGGLGPISYGALGIYWSRMHFSGAGAHTLNSRGRPHPGRAAARCILDIYTVPLPSPTDPVPAWYNVGIVSGGKVVNAIPQEVAFTVDLRTVDAALITQLDAAIVAKCRAAAAAEGVDFRREWIQRSAAGGRPEQLADRRTHPLVQTAIDVLEYLGFAFGDGPKAVPSGSTDANAGVVRGIPSVSVGRSLGGDQHTLSEWADVDSARIGTKQIILLVAALAELDERVVP